MQVSEKCTQEDCKLNSTDRIHSVVVEVIDSGYPSRNAWFTLNISVFNVNEGPPNIHLSNYVVYENHSVGNAIGFVTCENLEGDDVTFTINDPSETFDEQNKHLVLKKRLDFEKKDEYDLTLVAMDSGIPSVRASKLYTLRAWWHYLGCTTI